MTTVSRRRPAARSAYSTAGRWRDMNIANLKLALRVLARRKVFTAISLVGITLTLVVLMVATAILDNVFAAGKPEPQPDRLPFLPLVRPPPKDLRPANPPRPRLLQTPIPHLA